MESKKTEDKNTNQALAPTRVRLNTNKCVKNQRWSKEEDSLLFSLVKKTDSINWHQIASNFPNKTTQQVTERWEKVLDPDLVKGSWTREEDETIINFVRENGSKNWTRLSSLLPGRIGKQCRERWRNHLDPNIIHTTWTEEEDLKLLSLHNQFGNKWVKISAMMPGRSDNSIKNRWNSTLKKIANSTMLSNKALLPPKETTRNNEIITPFINPMALQIPKVNSKVEETKPETSPRVFQPAASVDNGQKVLVCLQEEKTNVGK